MDRGTLHTIRLMVPGVMTLLLVLTLMEPSLSIVQTLKELDFSGLSGIGLAVITVGALYTVFDARYRLTGFSWEPIQSNIMDRLLEIARDAHDVSREEEEFLRNKRRLLDIFYRLLDNDESLLSRQQGVRLNGLLVTSVLDLSLLSCSGWWIHFGFALWRSSFEHMIASVVGFVVWIFALSVLLPLAMKRHLNLSNEQLDFIDTHYRPQLHGYVNEALSRMR